MLGERVSRGNGSGKGEEDGAGRTGVGTARTGDIKGAVGGSRVNAASLRVGVASGGTGLTLRAAVPGERAGGGRLNATNSFSPHALGKSTQPCSQLRGRQSPPVASALGGGTCPLSYRKRDCRACPIGLAPAPPKAEHARTGLSGQAQEGHQLCASLLAPAGAGSFRTAHWQRIRALAANPVGERRREGTPALCHSGSQGAGV